MQLNETFLSCNELMNTAQDWNVITADYEELVEPFTASFVEELLSPYEAMLPGSNLLDLI